MADLQNRSTGVPAGPAESVAPAGPPAAPVGGQADGALNPAALTVEQLARMMGVPAGKVRDHVAAGAPTGPGGTINLVHYAAWLNQELGRRDGD